MLLKLTDKDKKILKIGAIAALVILVYAGIISPFFDSWSQIRSRIYAEKNKIAMLNGGSDPRSAVQRAALFSIVPLAAVPESENLHRIHFASKFNMQLMKAGMKVRSLQYVSGEKYRPEIGLKQQRLQCRGSCGFAQLLDLLTTLSQNPYLVGIEDLQLTTDPKNPQEMEVVITVSTFVK
jgi:hypothetical protein